MIGGIARNHNGETCDHHIGGPESADIVAFALALPLSNENEKSSNSDKALDMFLIVKVSTIFYMFYPIAYYGCSRVTKDKVGSR